MSIIKLNETPVRTCKNFNINNIELENFSIPQDIKDFKNVKIFNDSSEIKIDRKTYCSGEFTNNRNSKFSSQNEQKMIYGVGDALVDIANSQPNFVADIVANCKQNKETRIDFKFDENNINLIENVRIIANENTVSTVIFRYDADSGVQVFHNAILNAVAKNGSVLNIIIMNFLNKDSNNFVSIENTIEDNAKINYIIIDFGGKNSITNYYSNLTGTMSDNSLNTIYLGTGSQMFDLNYIGELRGEKSNINIEVQGALKDNAKKHFKGTIDFKKGCKKATGNENENCILLSDNAKSIALPMLLCSEEEVEGNHSSSAGKIDEKELFYIMSRGFERKDAMKLMVRAKFNKILEGIENTNIRNYIVEMIDKRLD